MSTASVHSDRRQHLTANFAALQIDALLVTSLINVRYLTGFTGSNAFLLVEPGRALLFTDGRYLTQVALEADCPAKIVRGSTIKGVTPVIRLRKLKRIGIESAHMTVEMYAFLASAAANSFTLLPVTGTVESLRMVKSPEEIALIRAAVQLTSAVFARSMRSVKAGMSERDLAAEIDYQMLRGGADKPAFDTIVAFGRRAALPHASPTSTSLQSNELLLIDMGAQRQGYSSDMTRIAFFGRPSAQIKSLYRAVLESQLAAIDTIRPGATAHQVDRAARSTLKKHGLDKVFLHSTGHGLGLEIHEPPRLGRKEPTPLRPGMVITVEPGAYQEGFTGVRIEDTVLVTQSGCEVLTPTSKELFVL